MNLSPNFTLEMLNTRLSQDISKFKMDNNILYSPVDDKEVIPSDYETAKKLCCSLFEKMKSFNDKTIFNYRELISKPEQELSVEDKQTLWILRNKLFFTMLHCIGHKMENAGIEKTDYIIGVFGSMRATSDIDVGITCLSTNNNVAEIIKMFEDFSINTLKISTLSLDIEMYSGMITIKCGKSEHFLINTNLLNKSLSHSSNKEIQKLVFLSILRNYAIGLKELGNSIFKVKKMIKVIDAENIISDVNNLNIDKTDSIRFTELINLAFKSLSKKDMETIKGIINEYIGYSYDKPGDFKNYNKMRNKYYKFVRIASETTSNEKIMCNRLIDYSSPNSPVISDPKEDIPNNLKDTAKIISQTGYADFYKAESYVLAPTIIHVVRIMQSNESIESTVCKYPFSFPSNSQCAMSDIAYKISALEQIGYMLRFKNNVSKFTKYYNRTKDAFDKIVNFDDEHYLPRTYKTKVSGTRKRNKSTKNIIRSKRTKRNRGF